MFNKLTSEDGLLNKSSCLSIVSVTKFITVNDISLVTLCCATYVTLRYSTTLRRGLVEDLSWTQAAQQSVTQIKLVTVMNMVTSKEGAKHEICTMNRPLQL